MLLIPSIIVPYGNNKKLGIIMMNCKQTADKRKEGVARLEFVGILFLFFLGRIIMIIDIRISNAI